MIAACSRVLDYKFEIGSKTRVTVFPGWHFEIVSSFDFLGDIGVFYQI